MKKSRVFMAVGSLVLAATAIFATKANKRFAQINTAYLKGTSNSVYFKNSSGFSFLTTASEQVSPLVHYPLAVGSLYTDATSHVKKYAATLVTTNGNPLYYK